jgi:hypothetical protein
MAFDCVDFPFLQKTSVSETPSEDFSFKNYLLEDFPSKKFSLKTIL